MTCDKQHNERIRIYSFCDLCKTSKVLVDIPIEEKKKDLDEPSDKYADGFY